MTFDANTIIDYLQSSGLLLLSLLLGGFLPFILLTILIVWLSSITLKRIMALGGFRLLYVTAWLGVPVHECSHAIAAIIGRHRIRRFAPFQPNPKTGQLGIVETTYDDKKWWAKWVGNTLIPIAPLFGGTVVMYFLIRLLFPAFTVTASSHIIPPSPQHLETITVWQNYLETIQYQLLAQFTQLWHPELFAQWETYLIGYVIVCVALHLSPSATDWMNIRKPLLYLALLLVVGCLVITPFPAWTLQLHTVTIQFVTWLLPAWLFVAMMVAIVTIPVWLLTKLISVLLPTRTGK